jgi:hypothetical protein
MIRTTNFKINKEKIDYENIDKNFTIVRYIIPDEFRYKSKIDKNLYAKFHNEYKEKLDLPYYFFSHDTTVFSERSCFSLYVLYLKKNNLKKTLEFSFLRDLCRYQILGSKDVLSHVLVKLFLANFFYDDRVGYRVTQSRFLIFGDRHGESKALALDVQIRLYKEEENYVEFNIIPQTKLLRKVKENFSGTRLTINTYYELILKDLGYFKQIKPSHIHKCKSEKWTYVFNNNLMGKRPSLPWYNDRNTRYESSRSFIIFSFQEKFLKYLNQHFGSEAASSKTYNVEKFVPIKTTTKTLGIAETGLPISRLGKIYVYDNRLKTKDIKNSNSITSYIHFLNEHFSKELFIEFIHAPKESTFLEKNPTLIIQDVNGAEFGVEEEINDRGESTKKFGFLTKIGYEDPKIGIYSKYASDVPLQSLNVNINSKDFSLEHFEADWKGYFNYPPIDIPKYSEIIKVCLNELYLKDILINKRSVRVSDSPFGKIDCDYSKYIYIYNGILLFIDNNKLEFVELKNSEGKKARSLLIKKLGLDWSEIETKLIETFSFNEESGENALAEKIKGIRILACLGNVFYIEESEERLLFPFDKGYKRNKITKEGFEGINYNVEDAIYLVGSPLNMYLSVPRAYIIRRIKSLKQDSNFEKSFLDIIKMMHVKFVRNKQFTVYPFMFDLISLYKQDIMSFQ